MWKRLPVRTSCKLSVRPVRVQRLRYLSELFYLRSRVRPRHLWVSVSPLRGTDIAMLRRILRCELSIAAAVSDWRSEDTSNLIN